MLLALIVTVEMYFAVAQKTEWQPTQPKLLAFMDLSLIVMYLFQYLIR